MSAGRFGSCCSSPGWCSGVCVSVRRNSPCSQPGRAWRCPPRCSSMRPAWWSPSARSSPASPGSCWRICPALWPPNPPTPLSQVSSLLVGPPHRAPRHPGQCHRAGMGTCGCFPADGHQGDRRGWGAPLCVPSLLVAHVAPLRPGHDGFPPLPRIQGTSFWVVSLSVPVPVPHRPGAAQGDRDEGGDPSSQVPDPS